MHTVMNQPNICDCAMFGQETVVQNELINADLLVISTRFSPGCHLCAICTCIPVTVGQIEEATDVEWQMFAEVNQDCPFCTVDDEEWPACPMCSSPDEVCEHNGREHRRKRIRRAFMRRLGKACEGRGGKVVRSLSRKLTGRVKDVLSV